MSNDYKGRMKFGNLTRNERYRRRLLGSDSDFESVVLLASFDGADQATTYTSEDSYAREATFRGNTQLDTAVKKFGASSFQGFGGINDRLEFPDAPELSLGSEDFTIECWTYFDSIRVTTVFFVSKWNTNENQSEYAVGYDSTGEFRLWISADGSNAITKCQWGNTPNLNQWYHVAATYDGTTYRLFVDGDLKDSDVSSTTQFAGTAAVAVCDREDGTLEHDGWVDDLRITKGLARYTESFSPPTSPHPSS